MNKTQALKELKGFGNGITVIDGTAIAHVGWLEDPWMIIENEDTWEEVAQRDFSPILAFRTRADLLNAIITTPV